MKVANAAGPDGSCRMRQRGVQDAKKRLAIVVSHVNLPAESRAVPCHPQSLNSFARRLVGETGKRQSALQIYIDVPQGVKAQADDGLCCGMVIRFCRHAAMGTFSVVRRETRSGRTKRRCTDSTPLPGLLRHHFSRRRRGKER